MTRAFALVLLAACSAPGASISGYGATCGALGDRSYDRVDITAEDGGNASARLCHGDTCTETVEAGPYPDDENDGTASAWCASTQTYFYIVAGSDHPYLTIWAGKNAPIAGDSFTCREGFVPSVVLDQVTDTTQCTSSIKYATD